MDDFTTLNARLVALEMDRAHQDRAIEDLSEAVAAQWKLIEQLKAELARLKDEIREAADAGPGEADPLPPHY